MPCNKRLHAFPQTIAVKDTEAGIQLVTRKKGAAPNAVRPAYATTTIRPRSGTRRAAGVTAKLAKRGYRPDLRAVSPSYPLRPFFDQSFVFSPFFGYKPGPPSQFPVSPSFTTLPLDTHQR